MLVRVCVFTLQPYGHDLVIPNVAAIRPNGGMSLLLLPIPIARLPIDFLAINAQAQLIQTDLHILLETSCHQGPEI